jgi:hypothetical protein
MRILTDEELKTFLTILELPLLQSTEKQLWDEKLIQWSSGNVYVQDILIDCKYCSITDKGCDILDRQDPIRVIRLCSKICRYNMVDRFMNKVPKDKLVEFLTSDDYVIRDAAKVRYES